MIDMMIRYGVQMQYTTYQKFRLAIIGTNLKLVGIRDLYQHLFK